MTTGVGANTGKFRLFLAFERLIFNWMYENKPIHGRQVAVWRDHPDLIDFSKPCPTKEGMELVRKSLRRVPVVFGFDGLGVLEKHGNK